VAPHQIRTESFQSLEHGQNLAASVKNNLEHKDYLQWMMLA
jgi:hypothetical protein